MAGSATFGAVTLNSRSAEARHTTINVQRWQRRAPSVVSPGGRGAAGTWGCAGQAPNPPAGPSRATPCRPAVIWPDAVTRLAPSRPGGDYTLAPPRGQQARSDERRVGRNLCDQRAARRNEAGSRASGCYRRAVATGQLISWLCDSDPALRWQVERDLAAEPPQVWEATRARIATEGFGARLLEIQDPDGQWAGGAFFPANFAPEPGGTGQPW